MAYTTQKAIDAFDRYAKNLNMTKRPIPNTKNRGFLFETSHGDKFVVFVYPLVHKQDNTKNYFDTRDSGAFERGVAWQYAINNGFKYFCVGVNNQVEKYENYIFSLECQESVIERISGTKEGVRSGPGNQIIIPNDYEPKKDFERIRNRMGIYIAVVHKNALADYLEKYDNRPSMGNEEASPEITGGIGTPEEYDEYMQQLLGFGEEEAAEENEMEGTAVPIRFVTGYDSDFPRNGIIFGAPGTGKSYKINKERKNLLGGDNEEDYERVTFHPDYSYANFAGTYKPVPCQDNEGKDAITYEYVPGPFMRVYVNALKNGRTDHVRPYLLIIEEINRANAASVFGDIFQLLDRDEDGASEYPIQASEDIRKYLASELGGNPEDYAKIRIPDNMFIWATMNSADQGVFPMDTAFKRRWDFTYLGIDDNDADIRGKTVVLGTVDRQRVEWNKLRKAVNHYLAKQKINEDKQLGPYFIARRIVVPENGDEIDSRRFIDAFKNKVIMYLFEDAARQKRPSLFEGCSENSSRYSEICREFELKGIRIFNQEIVMAADPVDLMIEGRELTDQEV